MYVAEDGPLTTSIDVLRAGYTVSKEWFSRTVLAIPDTPSGVEQETLVSVHEVEAKGGAGYGAASGPHPQGRGVTSFTPTYTRLTVWGPNSLWPLGP